MANYANTVVLNALAMLDERANKDFRPAAYGATQAFNQYKKDVILNYDEFKNIQIQSDLQTKQIDYLRRKTATVNSTRAASLTGAMGDSTRDTLTFVTYSREFTLSDDNARNNTFKAAQQLAAQMRNARLDIAAEIEGDAVAKLESYKNLVEGGREQLGVWDSSNYVYEIANTNKDEYFNYMETGMRQLDYSGGLQEIHTHAANALINWQTAQGPGNSDNLTFQYPAFQFYTSGSITNLSDYYCTSYVCEERSLALLDWIPGKNRENLNHGIWDFRAIPDPMGMFESGFALAVYHTVVDTSAGTGTNIGGNTQDAVWLYEMSIDVAFYIPTITTQKLVNKYGLLKS